MIRFLQEAALRALNSIPLLYLAIFLTGPLPFIDLYTGEWYVAQMMSESGELSIWYLILTLSISPILAVLSRLKRGARVGVWLLRRRKHFGLASFAFAAAHTAHYFRFTGDAGVVWLEAFDFEFFVGWLGGAVLLALAVTSNKASKRALGRWWKRLHRLVYPAAAAIALHWFWFEFYETRVLFWCGVVLAGRAVQLGLRRGAKVERTKRETDVTRRGAL